MKVMGKLINMEKFAERVRSAMAKKGLNAAQLAKTAHIAPSALSMYFSGERTPSGEVLIKLGNSLDVAIDYLVGKAEGSEFADLFQNQKMAELVRDFADLKPGDQERVLEFIRMLKDTDRR